MTDHLRAAGDTFRLAVIGDLHTHWDEVDLAQFAQTDYDLLFFTGDLGGGTTESSIRMARGMAALRQPTLVMPGNNDTGDIDALAAELAARGGMSELMDIMHGREVHPEPPRLCGYSRHLIAVGSRQCSIITGRPHSMGGPNLSFPEHMARAYGIESLAHSTQRLVALVDECLSDEVIFLAHNGPLGLGEHASAMWGCDFRDDGGDWGDPDLSAAIEHAEASGKRVLAVVAGHMHLRTKQGDQRPWLERRGDTLYINAARVPRIFADSDDVFRHHVAVTLTETRIDAEEVLVPQYG